MSALKRNHQLFTPFYFFVFLLVLAAIPVKGFAQDETTSAITDATPATDATLALTAETELAVQPEEPWSLSCELGGSLSSGNTRAGSIATACNSSRSWKKFTLSGEGAVHWGRAKFGGVGEYASGTPITEGNWIISERSAYAELREDYIISADERNFLFSTQGIATNQFAGYHLRINAGLGAGRIYVLNDTQKHVLELGLVYEHEQGIIEDDNRVGLKATLRGETKFHEASLLAYRVSYLPSVMDSSDWRLEGFGGLTFKISDRFSYKSGFNINYDNAPSLIVPLDPFGTELTGLLATARKTEIIWNNVLVLSIL